jgi:hypothetical protein
MNTYCVGRSSRPAGLFSLGLLDVPLWVRLRRPLFREASGGLRSRPPRYGIPEDPWALWFMTQIVLATDLFAHLGPAPVASTLP